MTPSRRPQAVFPRLIYGPEYPYGRPDLGTPGSVKSITREDVVAFIRRIMVPGNAALVIVGDVRPDAIAAALEARLAAWPPGPVPAPPRARAGPDTAGRAARLPHRQGRRARSRSWPSGGSAPRASRPISPR